MLDRETEKSWMEIYLRFLKDIVRLTLERGEGRLISMKIARWSEMWRLMLKS